METRAHALIAGSFVLGLLVLGAAVVYWLRSGQDFTSVPYVVVSESSVFGLAEHTAVSYRGVPVGTVERIRLDTADFDRVLIDIEVDERVPLGERSHGLLRLEGITGSVQLEIADDGDRGPRLETSRKSPARIPLRQSFLGALETTGQNLLTQLEGLVTDLRGILSNPQESSLSTLLATAEEAMTRLVELQEGVQEAVDLLPDLVRQGSQTFENVDVLMGEAQRIITDVGRDLEGIDEVLVGVRRVGDATGEAGEVLAQETLPRVNALVEELGQAADNLGELVRTLERNPQSLLFGPPRQEPAPGERGYKSPPP
ncbi:MAG TPA: MlaD family protein [Thermoanaerobaculia bacterium]|nr:MlaD family protein [Thermoanaerobaculia bacterium]